ncbi:YbhB/YbcL family Raf kinase inhibitor-like protein [Lentzea sp. NPDC051213]|uniref:YbhB/YbcL family Raf kinase inhibitor-like protein n=1 Tax=Lentzea sp. NPDC051213 TaxID=3364126 RepID=UPI003792AB67
MRKIKYQRWALTALSLGLTAAVISVPAATGAPASAEHIRVSLGGHQSPYRYLPKVPSFSLTSTTFKNGRALPADQRSGIFGAPGGKDISPELSWRGFPAGTKSFVVSMYDPEAPTGSGFWHWVVANIPAGATSLPLDAGALNSAKLPAGAIQLGGDAGMPRYIGAAPPAGVTHHYYITVTALDVPSLDVTAGTSGALLGFLIGSHTIGRATLLSPTRG